MPKIWGKNAYFWMTFDLRSHDHFIDQSKFRRLHFMFGYFYNILHEKMIKLFKLDPSKSLIKIIFIEKIPTFQKICDLWPLVMWPNLHKNRFFSKKKLSRNLLIWWCLWKFDAIKTCWDIYFWLYGVIFAMIIT